MTSKNNKDKREKKIIKYYDLIMNPLFISIKSNINSHRDWLLGGNEIKWRWHIDPITNDLILERK
jgi:hypothetical protein